MIALNERQERTLETIRDVANLFGVDPDWAASIALQESSLGVNQCSRTGCLGVFQMSSIAMKDLLSEMAKLDDDLIDIACGVLFLRLLKQRWSSIETATSHFCDPNDRSFYVGKVLEYMKMFREADKS